MSGWLTSHGDGRLTMPRTHGKGKPMIQQVQPAERVKPAAPEGGPTGRGERQQQVKPAERVKPAAPEGDREKAGKKKPVEHDESPEKDKKKQDEGKPGP